MFERRFNEKLKSQLNNTHLFKDKLHADIKNGKVFPAIRRDRMDFYHKGGKLFSFDRNGFTTHVKYASVIENKVGKGDYVAQDALRDVKLISNFSAGYKRIKENCSLYSGIEAEGVSRIYHNFSYADTSQDNNIVVLDIEITFRTVPCTIDKKKSTDRIDILLFNKKEKTLRFYEAKHYSNTELWSKKGTGPAVRTQISSYERQIGQKKDRIIEQYAKYIRSVNDLFGIELPAEEIDVDKKVPLLVFGFDRNQLNGRMKNILIEDGSLKNICYYLIGNVAGININNAWKAVKCS